MAVTTVRAENRVLRLQMRADTGGDRFLANVGVARAVDQTALVRPGQSFFAETDGLHLAVETQADVAVK